MGALRQSAGHTGRWVKGSNISAVRDLFYPSVLASFPKATSVSLTCKVAIMTSISQRVGRVFALRIHKKPLREAGSSTSYPSPPTTDPPDSLLSEAGDLIELVSPMVHVVAGVIPVAGTPLKAAVDGLLYIIQIIDVGLLALFRGIPSDCVPDNQTKQGRS